MGIKKLTVIAVMSSLMLSGCSIKNATTSVKNATNEHLCEMSGYYSQRDNLDAYHEVMNEMDNRPLHSEYFTSPACFAARNKGVEHYGNLDDAGKIAGVALAIVAVVAVAAAASQDGSGSAPSQEYDCTKDLFGTLTCEESK